MTVVTTEDCRRPREETGYGPEDPDEISGRRLDVSLPFSTEDQSSSSQPFSETTGRGPVVPVGVPTRGPDPRVSVDEVRDGRTVPLLGEVTLDPGLRPRKGTRPE